MRRFPWRAWTTLAVTVGVLMFGALSLLNRPPDPADNIAQPIGLHSGTQVGSEALADAVARLAAAIATSDWEQAESRYDMLRDTWQRFRPTTSEVQRDVWSQGDVAEFDAALDRLENWIDRRQLEQATAEIAIMRRTANHYIQP